MTRFADRLRIRPVPKILSSCVIIILYRGTASRAQKGKVATFVHVAVNVGESLCIMRRLTFYDVRNEPPHGVAELTSS